MGLFNNKERGNGPKWFFCSRLSVIGRAPGVMPGYILTGALILYPVVIHLSILFEESQWAFWYLLLVFSFFVLDRFTLLWRLFAALSIISLLLLSDDKVVAKYALFSFPVFICLSFLIFFARTLRTGQTPLLTRIAILTDGQISDQVLAYTRKLTIFWSLVFLFLTIESILLAMLAPLELWSLFTNVLNYIFILVLFIVEYFVRRRVLHEWRGRNLRQFIESLTKLRFRNVR